MAGIRIRLRREGAALAPSQAGETPGELTLGAFIWPAVIAIVLLALVARAYNVDWDEGSHLHPDERHLSSVAAGIKLPSSLLEYFDSNSSTLNPYNRDGGSFVYGSFPLFLTKVVANALGKDNYDHLYLVGRWLSALFSAGAVLLVFLIGRRLYSSAAGLIGAVLMASAPLAIQQAHFFVVDPFLTLFTTALLFYSVRIVQDGRRSDYALAGLMLGLAMACKVTALVVAPVLLAAVAARLWPAVRERFSGRQLTAKQLEDAGQALISLALAVFVALVAFRVAQPYAFDTPTLTNLGLALNSHWLSDQSQQRNLLGGDAAFPPSVQWIGRSSYVYPLSEMARWGMGPAFAIAGWAAFGFAAFRLVRRGDGRQLLPVLFVLVYFGFMGRQFSLYLRYFLPLYPVLALLAGYALVEFVRGAATLAQRWGRPQLERAGYGVVAVVLALSLLAGIAYVSIYTRPTTRVEASRWIYETLPAGSTLASEHWDDELPLLLADVPPKRFEHVEMPLYDPDNKEKIATLIDNLDKADYVILSSNRLRLSVPRDRVSHPVSSRYYDLLFSGQLGFKLKQEFTSYPGLLGISVSDDGAEESQSSYDHPRVLVFEKTPQFSRQKVESLLGAGPFTDVLLTPKQADHNGLLLSPADLATQRAGGTWASVFSDSGLAKSNPTLLWLIALEAAALAMTPIAFVLFRRLPDRGYLLAKPLGLFVLGYVVWLLPSLKLTHFDQTEALIVLATMLVASGVVAWRARESLDAWFGEHWRFVLICEALFILAFFFFRELRMENPDLWHAYRGGEKPMDLAYLTAVARSTTLPPYDPWFAGGYINYYYLGQFFTATLIKLTTIPPEIAFNLAIPTYFALAVGGAFSVSYNLAHKTRSLMRRRPGFASIPRWSVYAAGLLGVFFVTIAGNFDALDQLSERLSAVSSWHISTPVPLLDAFVNGAGGLYQASINNKQLPEFDFWRSSRMMPPTISITEFPYFSFLFADLHAHMMAIPFQLLSIGLGLVLVLGDREPAERRTWALVALVGLLVGGLRWLNSWDYPPFLLLALTAVAIGERRLEGGPAAAAGRFVAKAALLGIVSVVAWQPFLSAYQTPVAGLHPTPETTPLRQYLAHFGIFLAPIAAWLLFLIGRALRSSPVQRPGLSIRGLPEKKRRWVVYACAVIAATVVVCLILGMKGHVFVAALVPPLVLAGYLMLHEALQRRADDGLRLYILALVALGLGLSAGVDLVTLDGDIQRMNTVFKFYLHAWIVFALVATFVSWYLVFVIWPRALAVATRPAQRYVASAGLVGLTMLLLAAVVYPMAATRPRLDDRFAGLPNTLDGTDYMKVAIYQDERGPIELKYDLDGIEWMRQNVEGTPAIVEGNTGLYKWGGRFSIYTGLPAVLGWDWHQTQQRGELAFMVQQRLQEVDSFYGKNDVAGAQAFLRKYDVRYVILGQTERLYYPASALRKFDSGLGGTIEVAYKNPKLTIYRVKPEALAAASAFVASQTPTSEVAP